MKHLLPAVLIVFCGTRSLSATVVTAATCSVQGTSSKSSPTSCSINTANSAPSAAASITINQLTVVPTSGGINSFTTDVSGAVTAIPLSNTGSGANIDSSARSLADITYQFSSSGPVRPGVITLVSDLKNLQSGPGNDSAQLVVSVGTLASSCKGISGSCIGFLGSSGLRSFVFSLGNTFTYNFSEDFQAIGDSIDGTGFANGGASFTFRLFEADGVTPVAISDAAAPEPSSLSLFLLATPAAWLYKRRQRP